MQSAPRRLPAHRMGPGLEHAGRCAKPYEARRYTFRASDTLRQSDNAANVADLGLIVTLQKC
jgi:hypothetical protein